MNFASLIKAFNAVMAFRDAARTLKGGAPADTALTPGNLAAGGFAGHLEARLTNVVVAALKEAFDRDHVRLELERAQLDEQRRRAEEALKMELRRQAADRELGRLRLLAGTALVGWIASLLVLAFRIEAMSGAGRAVLGAGWLLLLGSLAAAFSAQGRVGEYMPSPDRPPESGPVGTAALWLAVSGLALTAISLLV
jgi:hypothetical protein